MEVNHCIIVTILRFSRIVPPVKCVVIVQEPHRWSLALTALTISEKTEKMSSFSHVLQKTLNLDISRRRFTKDVQEVY